MAFTYRTRNKDLLVTSMSWSEYQDKKFPEDRAKIKPRKSRLGSNLKSLVDNPTRRPDNSIE